MVNAQANTTADRRERPRAPATGSRVLGQQKLNPLGDLHTVQHLSARLARSLRAVFEPVLRAELRIWAEPLVVQRVADYRAERDGGLTGWAALSIAGAAPGARAIVALDGRVVLQMLDLFFGGTGALPGSLPDALSPAAEALVARLAAGMAAPMGQAWEPVAPIRFEARGEAASLPDGDEAIVVTRFGLAAGDAQPQFVDILYPVAALKPHAALLAGKVVDKAEPDPRWRHELTRAAMDVRFPVRSVLAEPVVRLSTLMNLQVGDVIPISFGADVPVMIGAEPLGTGTVGTSNGHAAVRLTSLARNEGQDL
jgi:flagellar motor switch protein FliM